MPNQQEFCRRWHNRCDFLENIIRNGMDDQRLLRAGIQPGSARAQRLHHKFRSAFLLCCDVRFEGIDNPPPPPLPPGPTSTAGGGSLAATLPFFPWLFGGWTPVPVPVGPGLPPPVAPPVSPPAPSIPAAPPWAGPLALIFLAMILNSQRFEINCDLIDSWHHEGLNLTVCLYECPGGSWKYVGTVGACPPVKFFKV
ncbi:MAG: hypothetical protein AAFW97_17050 [Pseudomonadota bacterium]